MNVWSVCSVHRLISLWFCGTNNSFTVYSPGGHVMREMLVNDDNLLILIITHRQFWLSYHTCALSLVSRRLTTRFRLIYTEFLLCIHQFTLRSFSVTRHASRKITISILFPIVFKAYRSANTSGVNMNAVGKRSPFNLSKLLCGGCFKRHSSHFVYHSEPVSSELLGKYLERQPCVLFWFFSNIIHFR